MAASAKNVQLSPALSERVLRSEKRHRKTATLGFFRAPIISPPFLAGWRLVSDKFRVAVQKTGLRSLRHQELRE